VATILVADDNSNIQRMVELALKELGYHVEKVGNGEHAVRRLPEIAPDLILADIFMPVRNGYELCEYVKGRDEYAHIPVVLLQGKFDPLDEHEMKRVRADGVLTKPFVPADQLIATVKTLLEKAEQHKAPAAARPATSPQATLRLSKEEIASMTGSAAETPPPAPEPEIAEYATAPPRIEISEAEKPLAFQELLETAPAEAPAEPARRGGQVERWEPEVQPAGIREEEFAPAPPAVEAAAAEVETPKLGGIKEELKQPSPEEPPIHVEFGQAEPMELVTDETQVSPAAADAAPLPELVTAASEWVASPPPAAPTPAEEPEALETPVPAPAAPPRPYEAPKLEELLKSVIQADAVPASAAPAVPQTISDFRSPVAPPEPAPTVGQVQAFTPPQPLDPAAMDALVERVLARLQPQVTEQIAREIVRPLIEALLRREIEK